MNIPKYGFKREGDDQPVLLTEVMSYVRNNTYADFSSMGLLRWLDEMALIAIKLNKSELHKHDVDWFYAGNKERFEDNPSKACSVKAAFDGYYLRLNPKWLEAKPGYSDNVIQVSRITDTLISINKSLSVIFAEHGRS